MRNFILNFIIFSLSFLSQSIVLAQEASINFDYLSVIDAQALEKSYNKSSSKNTANPFDTKVDLYQKIVDEMNLEYENIGKREAQRVLANKLNGVTGGLNSIGFNYRRPFVDFSLSVDRNLAPDLFDDKRWIVTDTCSIYIDASRVLSNLKDKKIIDLSEKNLAAFAGIVFKRTFTWVHYAQSYEEGLTTHFEKLFMPFKAMSFGNIHHLQNNEMIFKEDSLSVKAGGMVTAPLYTGITGMAGVLAKFEKLTRVEVVSFPHKFDSGADVHISSEKAKVTSTGLSLGIQADFLKILRITLLSYDFNYEMSSSYKIYLNFDRETLSQMIPGNPVSMELEQILKNREGDLAVLAPFVITEEKKISQSINHKYNFLLFGGTKNSKTQQIEMTSAGVAKTFFRHYFEKIKFTEDALSRFFASVIYAITNSEASAAKLVSDTKRITIEYRSEKNLLENREDLPLDSDQQNISLTFFSEFSAKKTSGFNAQKYQERAQYILERYSGVDPLAVNMVRDNYLKAPYLITGQYQVNTQGIRYLNSLSISSVFDHLDGLCDEYPRNKVFNFRNLFDNCRRSLQNDYIDYFKDLSHEKITSDFILQCEQKAARFIFSPGKSRAYIKDCLSQIALKSIDKRIDIPLWSLKNFANNVVLNSNSKVHYFNLFGLSNVFFYGNFSALTSDDRNFSTSFHEGAFKGLGVVDHYMRLENLRAPSSVVVDQ